MKRLVMVAILLFMATIQLMGQTTPTAKSTTPTAKPATSASPAANSSVKPAPKPEPKHVIYWDGTGRWEPSEADVRARKSGTPGAEKWPSEPYTSPAAERDERAREYDGSNPMMSSTSEGGAPAGSHESLRCVGPERRPCTEGMVRDLSRRMEERRAEHPALDSIRELTLETPDGRVSCRRHDGQACTREELRAFNEHVAEPLRCAIYYGASSSHAASHSAAESYANPAAPDTTTGTTEGMAAPSPAYAGATPGTAVPSTTSATTNNATRPNHTALVERHDSGPGYHPYHPEHPYHSDHPVPLQNRGPAIQNHAPAVQNHAAATGSHPTPSKPE